MWHTIAEVFPGKKMLIWALLTFLVPYSISRLFGWFYQKERINRGSAEENKSTLPNNSHWIASNSSSKPWTDWPPADTLNSHLQTNLNLLSERLGSNSDYSVREFNIGGSSIRAAVINLKKISDSTIVQEYVLKPLMMDLRKTNVAELYTSGNFKVFIKDHVLPLSKIDEAEHVYQVIENVLTGSTALLIDGISGSLILGTSTSAPQNFEEPLRSLLYAGQRSASSTRSTRISLCCVQEQPIRICEC